MPNPSLDWLNDLPDLRVTRVTRVTPQKSATNPVTHDEIGRVTRVTNAPAVTLVTRPENEGVTRKPAENLAVTHVTPVTQKTGSVPDDMRAGLDGLQAMRPPRITNPAAWPEIVADAVRITDEGWVARAIDLGWLALDLFGCSPNGEYEGLAVWLRTRRIILIDEHSAIAVADDARRHVFNRRDHEGAILLWELGGD